jgi:hypothetical protein
LEPDVGGSSPPPGAAAGAPTSVISMVTDASARSSATALTAPQPRPIVGPVARPPAQAPHPAGRLSMRYRHNVGGLVRLPLGVRVVLIIAWAGILLATAHFVVGLRPAAHGSTGDHRDLISPFFSPCTSGSCAPSSSFGLAPPFLLTPAEQLLVWLGAVGVWALASALALRGGPGDATPAVDSPLRGGDDRQVDLRNVPTISSQEPEIKK